LFLGGYSNIRIYIIIISRNKNKIEKNHSEKPTYSETTFWILCSVFFLFFYYIRLKKPFILLIKITNGLCKDSKLKKETIYFQNIKLHIFLS